MIGNQGHLRLRRHYQRHTAFDPDSSLVQAKPHILCQPSNGLADRVLASLQNWKNGQLNKVRTFTFFSACFALIGLSFAWSEKSCVLCFQVHNRSDKFAGKPILLPRLLRRSQHCVRIHHPIRPPGRPQHPDS